MRNGFSSIFNLNEVCCCYFSIIKYALDAVYFLLFLVVIIFLNIPILLLKSNIRNKIILLWTMKCFYQFFMVLLLFFLLKIERKELLLLFNCILKYFHYFGFIPQNQKKEKQFFILELKHHGKRNINILSFDNIYEYNRWIDSFFFVYLTFSSFSFLKWKHINKMIMMKVL